MNALCFISCIRYSSDYWNKVNLSSFCRQELPERLLLTYKPEESEEIPEPAPVEEEKAPVEEPVPVPSIAEVVSPPTTTEVADTGDLLVGETTH